MVETKTITELSHLAKELNSQSNALNDYIKALNDQLAPLNLGLEFWWNHAIQNSGLEYDSQKQKSERCTWLGYAKLEDQWQLAVKEETVVYEWNEDLHEEYPVSESYYTPLLQASRDIRLEAASHFDNFLLSLKEYAKGRLTKLKRAEQLAKLK